jgi:hypothetical protein
MEEDFGERFSFPLVTGNSSIRIMTEIKKEIMQEFSIAMASVFHFLLLHSRIREPAWTQVLNF